MILLPEVTKKEHVSVFLLSSAFFAPRDGLVEVIPDIRMAT